MEEQIRVITPAEYRTWVDVSAYFVWMNNAAEGIALSEEENYEIGQHEINFRIKEQGIVVSDLPLAASVPCSPAPAAGTTSFTINFATAVTGSVSYTCSGRN